MQLLSSQAGQAPAGSQQVAYCTAHTAAANMTSAVHWAVDDMPYSTPLGLRATPGDTLCLIQATTDKASVDKATPSSTGATGGHKKDSTDANKARWPCCYKRRNQTSISKHKAACMTFKRIASLNRLTHTLRLCKVFVQTQVPAEGQAVGPLSRSIQSACHAAAHCNLLLKV